MDVSVANCRALAGPWELGIVLLFRAHLRFGTPGGFERAAADLAEIDALSGTTGDRWLLGQVCGLRAEIETARGHYERARAEIETALRYAQELGAFLEMPFLLARIAETWVPAGRQRAGGENDAATPRRRANASASPTPARTPRWCAPCRPWSAAMRSAGARCGSRPARTPATARRPTCCPSPSVRSGHGSPPSPGGPGRPWRRWGMRCGSWSGAPPPTRWWPMCCWTRR
ncbi:hypothetical protein E4198_14075 [Streptomyces sp. RKND-216]|uniref:hypothetical protein n=1 Tax=Streptomyces sp. RKND-216 TaxID=2562581 RepID=UPI00109DEC50|nr:hypothetical protein [Streptomyces sp. RKND-216]THA25678.1 hypothetical protein E4198_14075 [Streptomyces sp. RKND-216]